MPLRDAIAWVVVTTLAAAAAFEVALALGTGSVGPSPGEDVPGAGVAAAAASGAMLVGALVAAISARRAVRAATLLAPAAAGFLVAFVFTFDPYYAPTLRRYADGAVGGRWIALVAAIAVAAGLATHVRPRRGGTVSALALLLVWATFLLAGDGH